MNNLETTSIFQEQSRELSISYGIYFIVLNIPINSEATPIAVVEVPGVDEVILPNPLRDNIELTVDNELLLRISPPEP